MSRLERCEIKIFHQAADKLSEDSNVQIWWIMFIDGITEGKIVVAAGGAHKRHLRIRLNEISMIFLEALRTDGGIGEFIRKFIHDNPSAENQRLDKKFDWDERRTGQLKK